KPGNVGWRARGELVDWAASEAWSEARADVESETAKKLGCLKQVRLAGPFGRGTARDTIRRFAAEAPGPWPTVWSPDPSVAKAPQIIDSKQTGCLVHADEPAGEGAF